MAGSRSQEIAQSPRHVYTLVSGGSVHASLILAEPVMFLSGFTRPEQLEQPPALLRGSLSLRIQKPTKIKSINLTFKGINRTEWPEGIPPEKNETFESKDVFAHTWPFFSATLPGGDNSSGAHLVQTLDEPSAAGGKLEPLRSPLAQSMNKSGHGSGSSAIGNGSNDDSSSSSGLSLAERGRSHGATATLENVVKARFGKSDSPNGSGGNSSNSAGLRSVKTLSDFTDRSSSKERKGYRTFQPAEYVYNFELLLPQKLPETTRCNFGSVRWLFQLSIDRPGAFKSNLQGQHELPLLRSLGQSNLESSEPIVINRDWEGLLHYEIVIAGKAFAIGGSIPIAFSLIPLAKVQCHRIRVYITEHTEYYCKDRRVHRVEPSHKFLLLEEVSKQGGVKGSLLKYAHDLSLLTEMEFDVKIPETYPNRHSHLRPNMNSEHIKVHHWIKVVMRLSRPSPQNPSKRKCYEVSIDSPITLVDQRTVNNSQLPAYHVRPAPVDRESELSLRPYQEFVQESAAVTASAMNRPIHFLRQPSIAPPPFDADSRPPEIANPPEYDAIHLSLADYRRRFEEYERAKPADPAEPAEPAAAAAAASTEAGSPTAAGSHPDAPPTPSASEAPKETGDDDEPPKPEAPFVSSPASPGGPVLPQIPTDPIFPFPPTPLTAAFDQNEETPTPSTPQPGESHESSNSQNHGSEENPSSEDSSSTLTARSTGSSDQTPSRESSAEAPDSAPGAGASADGSHTHSSSTNPFTSGLSASISANNDMHSPLFRPQFSEIIWRADSDEELPGRSSGELADRDARPSVVSRTRSHSPASIGSFDDDIDPVQTETDDADVPPEVETVRPIPRVRDPASAQTPAVTVAPPSPSRLLYTSPASVGSSTARSTPPLSVRSSNLTPGHSGPGPSTSAGAPHMASPSTPVSPRPGWPVPASTRRSSAGMARLAGSGTQPTFAQVSRMRHQSHQSITSPVAGGSIGSVGSGSGSGSVGSSNSVQIASAAAAVLGASATSPPNGNVLTSPTTPILGTIVGSSGSTGSPGFMTPLRGPGQNVSRPGSRMSTRSGSMSADHQGSVGSSGGRYFRQSSIVSIDLVDQRDHDGTSAVTRRPSRVSEISEVSEWYPLSRNNSSESIPISINEYEGRSPLLGRMESEADIGMLHLNENDSPDYDFEDDVESIHSAYYNILSP